MLRKLLCAQIITENSKGFAGDAMFEKRKEKKSSFTTLKKKPLKTFSRLFEKYNNTQRSFIIFRMSLYISTFFLLLLWAAD